MTATTNLKGKKEKVLPRSSIEEKDTWDITQMFPNVEAWREAFSSLSQDQSSTISQKKYTLSDPNSVKQLLENLFTRQRAVEKLYVYAHLAYDQDITNKESGENYKAITLFYTQFSEEISWIRPALVHLPLETIEVLRSAPQLSNYKFYLEKIFRAAEHTGTEREEAIIASSMSALDATMKAFSSLNDSEIPFGQATDSKGESHPVSHALASLYMQSTDRELRKSTYFSQRERYLNYKHTFSNLLFGRVNAHWFLAKASKFSSCIEAALFTNNIPVDVYTNLIESVKSNINTTSRYYRIKKKALGLDTFFAYDIYAPISESTKKKYSYEEAVALTLEALQPLGKDYLNKLHQGITTDRWVDRYENLNKRSGAYSSGCYDSMPYILLNYTGTVYDVSVLAHEAGHSMHTLYSVLNQSYQNAQYPIFLAEIASTLNEMLLMQHLIKMAESKDEKISLITRTLDTIFATLVRQTMFADFEYQIHSAVEKGIPLTPDFLSLTYGNLLKGYYGDSICWPEDIAIEWARIPHFYYNFYVYQYATGIIASLSFAERILSGEEGSLDDYLTFLKSGGSNFPLDILKNSGLDMSSIKPSEKAFSFITKLLNELEQLLA
ncbi:oligoendopeptidase F [Chlamydiifrater volucris]|uniref:oligoendopeptidase F n=1 Tax=Chlamydiifrater volucris TaxID=2681470 RepID=UPI0032B12AA4